MSGELLQLEKEASALKEAGDLHGSIAKLRELLAIDDSFVRAHLALSVLYYNVKDYENSVSHAERVCELEPNDSFNYSALSIAYQRAFELSRDPMYIQKAEMAMARSRMI
ncbi:MAG TPA: scaffolding protein [Pirellulaceae bacterium]|nr:scaffolding protein [Pirellulaceae bacterium]HMO93895.1 scaffolding protein [Pirellulaceae bacterium]HMP70884.1 scaffolding protein [Pirellulaceae bacterium]